MNTYKFYQDEQGTVWFRDCFLVEAETYEEACEKAIDMVKNGEVYEVEYSEPIWETFVPSESLNFPTLELLDAETEQIIWNNKIE